MSEIEAPGGGPAMPQRFIGAMVGLKGRNYYLEHCNRNKRGVVLDLKKPPGPALGADCTRHLLEEAVGSVR
jgi:crotonobetainyl-CoA:carnitine CoA-transferase CaiB-like acyl-CoA transferase